MPSAHPRPSRRQHLQALLLALSCAVLFLRDSLLPGRALLPHPPELLDVHMAEALATGAFDAQDAFRGNVGMGDKYLQSLCWDRVLHDRLRAGEIPRWTRDIGGGAPFVPQMAQPYQPINLLLLLMPSEQWYGWWFLLHQVLFGWFAYAFLRRLGCQHASALLGLTVAVLGLWTQCKLHHNVILTAALSLWPMLSATHDLVASGATGRARRFAIGWLGLWSGLSWSTGFVVVSLQATYLTLAFAALLATLAPRGERLRRLLPVGLGLVLGGALSLANMLPILMAAAVSARAGTFDVARLQALGLEWDHALTLCWPDLLSWAADRFYVAPGEPPSAYATRMPWSQLVLLAQPLRPEDHSAFQSWVETSFAVGLVPIAAATVAWFDRQRRALVVFFAAIALLSFGFATADQPFFGLARLVPGLTAGDLRRQLFTTAMALVVLATLGADVQLRSGRRLPMLLVLGGSLAASAIALAWLADKSTDEAFVRATAELYVADADHPEVRQIGGSVEAAEQWTRSRMSPGEAAHNRGMLQTTAWRALLVAALGLLALWLRPGRRAAAWLVLAIAELLHAGRGPVQTVPAERLTRLPAVLQPVADAVAGNGLRPRLQRLVVADQHLVRAALPGNFPGFLGLEDGGAYNPLPPARYEEFFTAIEPVRAGKANVAYGGAGVGSFHDAASLDHPLCDLYGLRFVLTRDAVPPSATLLERTPPGTGGFRLLERTTALPRATFVRDVDVIVDKAARLATLGRRDRDVAHRVVLEDSDAPMPAAGAAAAATVTIVEHRDERVVVHKDGDADGYLRLADPYDDGWRAALDGQPVAIHRADHYLRAVYVPAGPHEIVFTYDGPGVVWPLRCTLAALGVVAWLLLGGRRRA